MLCSNQKAKIEIEINKINKELEGKTRILIKSEGLEDNDMQIDNVYQLPA